MMAFDKFLFIQVLFALFVIGNSKRYLPTWESLDRRPLPNWYDDSKIGIFIHWGVFSVPSFHSEWFWWDWKGTEPAKDVVRYMQSNHPPKFTYPDFAPAFKAELFDANEWANIIEASGANYVVLTSKHHEGFCNWNTKYSWNWNSVDTGPHKDLVKELKTAIASKKDIKFGLYHSLFEWFHPLFLNDKRNNFTTQKFVFQKSLPELYELINQYEPDIIWSDMIDNIGSPEYWNSTEFLAWLYNDSPVKDKVVTNDRWGDGTLCKHGGYYTCQDRFNPGKLQAHKWENCFTIDKQSWGFRRNAPLNDYLTIEEIIKTVVTSISCNGNVLINVGPRADGKINLIFEERLRQLGKWLKVNGEAIYYSKPWTYQQDARNKNVWYTKVTKLNVTHVYAMVLQWPKHSVLELSSVNVVENVSQINLLGYSKQQNVLRFIVKNNITFIEMPQDTQSYLQWAWVLRFANIKPKQ